MLWVVFAAVTLLPAPTTGASKRVGVVCAGEGGAALQPMVEGRVSAVPEVTLRGMADLASALGEAPPAGTWSTDAAARAESAALLEAVQKEYYAGHLGVAQQKIEAASRLYEKLHDVPASVRVRVPFWQAAIKLKNGKTAAAETDLENALALSPDATVGDEFPPTFPDAVAAVKKRLPAPFHLTLAGMAPGSIARLDDVALDGSSFAAVAGPHKVEVVRPGYRTFSQIVEVTADATLTVTQAPALPAATENALLSFVKGSAVSSSAVTGIADRDHLDALVLVAADGENALAAVWFRGKPVVRGAPVPRRAPAPLLDFIAATLRPPAPVTTAAVPTPSPTPVAVATVAATPPATPTPAPTVVAVATATPISSPPPYAVGLNNPVRFHAAGGAAFLSVADTVSFKRTSPGASSYSLPLQGGGLFVGGRMDGEEFGALASVTYVGFGTVTVKGLPQGTVKNPGGSLTNIRLAADYLLAGTRTTRQDSFAAWVAPGATVELYQVSDQSASGVFVPYTRTSLDLRVGGSLPLRSPHLLFYLELMAGVSSLAESPAGTSGNSPKTGFSPGGTAGAQYGMGSHSHLCLDLSVQDQSAQFSGSGKAQFNTANGVTNLTRKQTLIGGGLSYRYAF